MLAPYLDRYAELVRIRALWRRGSRQESEESFDVAEYRPQTQSLVQANVILDRIRTDLPVYRIDGDYLKRLDDAPGSPEEKAAEVEAALVHEIRVRGESDPLARALSERLAKLRERKRREDADMLSLLDEFKKHAGDWATEQSAHQKLGISEGAYRILSVARAAAAANGAPDDKKMTDLAAKLDEMVEKHSTFAEWRDRPDVVRDIRQDMLTLLAEEAPELLGGGFVDEALTVITAKTGGG